MWRRSVFLALLSALCLASVLEGQGVNGRVTDRVTGEPLDGIRLRLIDRSGRELARVLSNRAGTFELAWATADTVVLLATGMGVVEARSAPFVMPPGRWVERNLVLEAAPVPLQGLVVRGGARLCELGAESGTRIQALWLEARRALERARAIEQTRHLRYRVRSFARELSPGGEEILSQTVDESEGMATVPIRSLAAEELRDNGWVRGDLDSGMTYFGPDAGVLLSGAFLETHCFDLSSGRHGHPALSFRPLPGAAGVDIKGTISLDRSGRRLSSVDFQYTGLDLPVGQHLAGGTIDFVELADGRWIVSSWRIRSPLIGAVPTGLTRGPARRVMLRGIHETGAEVLSAAGDQLVWQGGLPPATLRGVVRDSVSGQPLGAATIELVGTGATALSDEAGRFEMVGLTRGRYRLGVRHPVFDTLGVELAPWSVDLLSQAEADVELAVPTRPTLLALGCSEASGATIVGQVLDATSGAGLAGASVAVVAGGPATEPTASHSAGAPVSTHTDLGGWFALCGAPAARIWLVAALELVSSRPLEIDAQSESTTVVRLTLDSSATIGSEIPEANSGSGQVVMRLVDALAGTPIADGYVEFLDEAGQVLASSPSDAFGRLRVNVDLERTQGVRLRRLGYGESTLALDPSTLDGGATMEIRVAPEGIELPPVLVEARARTPHLDDAGFYRRSASMLGVFLERTDWEDRADARVTDILLRIPSMTVVVPTSANGRTTRHVGFRRVTLTIGPCVPVVVIDGVLRRSGGDSSVDLDALVHPQEVEAIEVYSGSARVPATFNYPGAQCGALVLWTRRGAAPVPP